MKRITSLLFFTLLFACQPETQPVTEPSQIVELEINEGTNMAVALSPDGETLAFDQLGRIWLMPTTGGEAVPVTDSLGNARQPSWSPDGSQITFQAYWEGNWHIYTVNRDGSGLKRITDGEYDYREPHWSPDGTALAYSSDRNGNYDIWTRDLVGENQNSITNKPSNQHKPAWSPDGKQIAYVSSEGSDQIVVRSMSSGETKVLYQSRGALAGVSWAPNGDQVFFNEIMGQKSQLKSLPTDGTSEAVILSQDAEEVFPFRVSATKDGNIYYTSNGKIIRRNQSETEDVSFRIKLFLDRTTYERKRRDFDNTDPQPVLGIAWPTISPDGKEIAFIALQDLWIRRADGKLNQLTNDKAVQIYPVWSPDGKKLAYGSDKNGSFGIWIMNLENSEERMLIETEDAVSGLSWSPSGADIAYTLSGSPRNGQLYKIDVGSAAVSQLGEPLPSSLGNPSWSPDGNTIALSSLDPYSTLYREGVNRVLLISSDGQTITPQEAPEHWSFGVRRNDGPVWSPDGKYMAAATRGNIWIFPVDQQGNVTDFPIQLTEELSESPSWSRDSKKLLYMSLEGPKLVDIDTKTTEPLPIDLTWNRDIPEGRKIIHAGSVINGISQEIQNDVDIIIEGHRIVEILPHDDSREADIKIDASDAYVIPGLMDIHIHEGSNDGERLGRAYLSWGVTTVRNPSSDPYDELNRREAIQSGKVSGPRTYYTGSPIDGSRIYYGGAIALQSEQQIELELQRAEVLGYDLIKTYVRLPDPLQKKVVEGAHEIGIPVTSHELYPAVSYNIDGTEHISGTSRIGYSSKISSIWKAYSDVTDILAKSGMSFTPTNAIISYRYLIHRDPSVLEDVRIKTFPNLGSSGIPVLMNPDIMPLETVEELYENLVQMTKDVHDKGGFIVAGTDSPIIPFGLALHLEMETYQDAGLTPFEILQTATINNAVLLNASDDLGSVEAGKIADLVILDSNPLEDIRNARQVRMTVKNGDVYKMQDLLEN